MLFLESWLQDYIDMKQFSSAELEALINGKIAELEEIRTVNDVFNGLVVVGRIENLRPHPDADRLNVFDVNVGSDTPVQIVSAAPNVREGLYVPLALPGTRFTFATIQPRPMRGVESGGMCCGKSELMIETGVSDGLWELHDDLDAATLSTSLGLSICKVFPELFPTQKVYDIKVLPDRMAVIGSHAGLALEIAISAGKLELLTPKGLMLTQPIRLREEVKSLLQSMKIGRRVHFSDTTGYSKAFNLFGLNIDSAYHTPFVFIQRMYLTERNVIGSIVDVSNYILADIGQPTHIFSTKKVTSLASQDSNEPYSWSVRTESKSVTFNGLGQLKKIEVPSGVEFLYDAMDNILAIPGISGGAESSSDPDETEFILEIANFDSEEVARSSFALSYRSEGSKIWAGKVQTPLMFLALTRYIEIIPEAKYDLMLAWSQDEDITSSLLSTLDKAIPEHSDPVSFDWEFIAQRIDGRSVEDLKNAVMPKLSLLAYIDNGLYYPNSFYHTVYSQDEVYLEVARLLGFDGLKKKQLHGTIAKQFTTPQEKSIKVKELFVEYGGVEIISRPFVEEEHVDTSSSLELINPFNSNKRFLRTSLLPSLMQAMVINYAKGYKPFIFEQNLVHFLEDGLMYEPHIDGLMMGEDPYYLTSIMMEIAGRSDGDTIEINELDSSFEHIGVGFVYDFGNGLVGHIIQIANSYKKLFGLPYDKPLWYIHLNMSQWNMDFVSDRIWIDETPYQMVKRSYSWVVPHDVTWSQIRGVLGKEMIEDVVITVEPRERFIVDETQSEVINYDIVFRPLTQTLTNEQIELWVGKVSSSILALDERVATR